MKADFLSYWRWFFQGSGGRPGYRRVVNSWMWLHLAVGLAISLLLPVNLAASATAVLLPLAGIFVGLSFAWAGNAQALMQSREIEMLSDHHEGGFVEYVFVYQTAILSILVTLVFWGLAGLNVFDLRWPTPQRSIPYFGVKWLLFMLCSLTVRECWHVVQGAQWMLLTQREIRKRMRANKKNERS